MALGVRVRRLGERDAASIGLLSATAAFLAYAFVTESWMAFALLALNAAQATVQPSLLALLSRRATPETQGEVQGISAMSIGVGQLAAPLLLTGTMARFTGPDAPVHFPGAAFLVAALFSTAALLLLRRQPRALPAPAAQIPPATAS